ncbi:MAG TPA: polynucleotide adenylyltransferase PcnB [Gammaproteobacteria bacterium]|nr:polynucleotide adenylyltransferase PcnB [Gammaproteobacteria bacterium]
MLIQSFQKFLSRFFKKEERVFAQEYTASVHGIGLNDIPLHVVKLMRKLEERGYEAYLVGGCVRDIMAGLKPKDFDVATSALPEEILKVFPRSIAIGRRFRIVHVRMGREIVETITFRGDPTVPWLQSHFQSKRNLDNIYGTKETDTYRRDFTINAFLYGLDGTLIDFHDGFNDFKNQRVRCIGDPSVRFKEDPVRMLRALRLQAKLNFSLDPAIEGVIRKDKHLLSKVSSQRMFQEIIKLCYQGHGSASWSIITEYQLTFAFLPWEEELNTPMKKDMHALVKCALAQSDERFHRGETLSAAFLLAILTWVYFNKIRDEGRDSTMRHKRFTRSFINFSDIAFKRIQPSRRIIDVVRQIFAMQNTLVKGDYRSVKYCIKQPRLRAAVDFLSLRANIDPILEPASSWWLSYINGDLANQEEMILQKKSKDL